MSNPQINPPAGLSGSGEPEPPNSPNPSTLEEGSSSELQAPGTPPTSPQEQTPATPRRSYQWEVNTRRRLMSPRAIETPSGSPLYIPPHLRERASSRPSSRASSQSSMTAPPTGQSVATFTQATPLPPPAIVGESVAIQAAPDMQDNSTQTIPTPPDIILLPSASPAAVTTPDPWYRMFTNLFRDIPGKPHTTAFVLVCGGWNISDFKLEWCNDRLIPLMNKVIHFLYIYGLFIVLYCLREQIRQWPTIEAILQNWVPFFY